MTAAIEAILADILDTATDINATLDRLLADGESEGES